MVGTLRSLRETYESNREDVLSGEYDNVEGQRRFLASIAALGAVTCMGLGIHFGIQSSRHIEGEFTEIMVGERPTVDEAIELGADAVIGIPLEVYGVAVGLEFAAWSAGLARRREQEQV